MSWFSYRKTTPPTTTSGRWPRAARTWPPAGRPRRTRPPRIRPTPSAYARWLPPNRPALLPRRPRTVRHHRVLPYYAYLAATGAFLENHCSGFGTNSTPNHLLIVGGQTPTLRNPPRNQPQPEWDMPSLPGHAADHGLTWKAYTGTSGYPVEFYTQLKGSPNIVRSDRSSPTPRTCRRCRWCGTTAPMTNTPSPISPWARTRSGRRRRGRRGRPLGGHRVPVDLGRLGRLGRPRRHPERRTHPRRRPTRLRPAGAAAHIRRPVRPGIDSRWNSHVSICKTVLDLLGLPPLGVPRVDDAVSLADLVDSACPIRRHRLSAPRSANPLPRRPPRHPHRRRRRRPRTLSRSARLCSGTASPCHHPTTNPSPPHTLFATERPTCRRDRRNQ